MYEQVRQGLRRRVFTGAVAPEEKLPSVRALAASLAINPNTIQRAYSALEEEGYVYTEPGRGAFAGRGGNSDLRREGLLEQFDTLVGELLFLGLTVRELTERVDDRAREKEGGRDL